MAVIRHVLVYLYICHIQYSDLNVVDLNAEYEYPSSININPWSRCYLLASLLTSQHIWWYIYSWYLSGASRERPGDNT